MTANSTVSQSIAVADPEIPENVIKPNADGSINISGSIAATSAAVATVANPSYSEGISEPLSQDLSGHLRVTGSVSTSAHATAAAPSYVEGSDDPLSVNLTGDLRTIAKIASAQTLATVTTVSTVTTITGVTPAFGATGASVPASAAYMGARTLAATPSDTTAQLNAPVLDTKGSLAIQPYGLGDNVISGLTTAMTGTTSTAVTGIGQPGSGLYNYITQITVGNSSATIGTFVEMQDGNGGTTFYTIPAAAVYGGATLTFPKPLKQPTSNTALYCKNTTTSANVIVSVSGFKGP